MKMEVLSVQNQYQGQFGVIGSTKNKDWTSPLTPPPPPPPHQHHQQKQQRNSKLNAKSISNNSSSSNTTTTTTTNTNTNSSITTAINNTQNIDIVDGRQPTTHNHIFPNQEKQQYNQYHNNHHHHQLQQQYYNNSGINMEAAAATAKTMAYESTVGSNNTMTSGHSARFAATTTYNNNLLYCGSAGNGGGVGVGVGIGVVERATATSSTTTAARYYNSDDDADACNDVDGADVVDGIGGIYNESSLRANFGIATTASSDDGTDVVNIDAAAVSELAQHLQEELRAAKSRHLACTEVSLPWDLMPRIAAEIIRTSEREPCGVRGGMIYIDFEEEPNQPSRRIASFQVDPYTVSTFELYLTLKHDKSGWTSLLPQFLKNLTRSSTILISPDFTLTKNKLYSCE